MSGTTITIPPSLQTAISDVLRERANLAVKRGAALLAEMHKPVTPPPAGAEWFNELFPGSLPVDLEGVRADWLDATATYAALWGDTAPDASVWDRALALAVGAAP